MNDWRQTQRFKRFLRAQTYFLPRRPPQVQRTNPTPQKSELVELSYHPRSRLQHEIDCIQPATLFWPFYSLRFRLLLERSLIDRSGVSPFPLNRSLYSPLKMKAVIVSLNTSQTG